MKNLIISNGQHLDDKEIVESDVILPDSDLSIEEASKSKALREEEEFIKKEQEVIEKVYNEYGIDISDIEDLNLVKIFERIRILKG